MTTLLFPTPAHPSRPMAPPQDYRENREAAAEVKFLVSPEIASAITAWARSHLAPDPHASGDNGDLYRISSVYFDSDQFDVFHRRASHARCKFRIRRYGTSERAFLERKLKTRGLVTKRRTLVSLGELPLVTRPEPPPSWPGLWYHQRLQLRRYRPICRITYLRTARVALTERGPIRLTLDRSISTSPTHLPTFHNGHQELPLLESRVILELKFRGETPTLFKLLASEFGLSPQPVSKYRLAVATLGLVDDADAILPPHSLASNACPIS